MAEMSVYTDRAKPEPEPEDEPVVEKMPLARLELRDVEGGHVAFVEIPVRDSSARVIRWKGRLFVMQPRTNQYREELMAEAQDAPEED